MISHILDLMHFLSSWMSDVEAPVKPQGEPTDPMHMVRFLLALQDYQRRLNQFHHWLKMARLWREHKHQQQQDYFDLRVRGANFELQTWTLKQQQKHWREKEWLLAMYCDWLAQYLLMCCVAFLFYGHQRRSNRWLLQPVVYQIPMTVRDELRHTKTLEDSLHKVQNHLQHLCPEANVDYLVVASVEYREQSMAVVMQDGTQVIHGVNDQGEAVLEILYPVGRQLSEEEQANRQGDLLAVLFFQKYLLNIVEHHHADFWSMHARLHIDNDVCPTPCADMSLAQRIECRMLYHLVLLGLEFDFNGQVLTLQRVHQEQWGQRLFAQATSEASQAIVACVQRLLH